MAAQCAFLACLACVYANKEPRLLISDPVALDYVLHKREDIHPKARLATYSLRKIMGQGLIASEGETHRRQRRAIQPGFSVQCIKNIAPVFTHNAAHLAQCIDTHIEKSERHCALVDIHALASSAAMDALGEAALGLEFGALAAAHAEMDGKMKSTHPLHQALERSLAIATSSSLLLTVVSAAAMFFPVLEHLPIGINSPEFNRATGVLDAVATDVVDLAKKDVLGATDTFHVADKGKRHSAERPDLLAFLVRANRSAASGEKKRSVRQDATLTDPEMIGQVSTFIFAGHETTSTQITWLLFQLARHPRAQQKLRDAICAARVAHGLAARPDGSADDRPLTVDELAEVPYLDWCIRESLRLNGASKYMLTVHTTSRVAAEHNVMPLSDGRRIPIAKGTLIVVPINSISRDPALWGVDAHCFVPERWSTPPKGAQVFPRLGGIAFLQGPRACIGSAFGTPLLTQPMRKCAHSSGPSFQSSRLNVMGALSCRSDG